jgi:hypothetical protein
MAKRLAGTLYFLTAIATFNVGLASFNSTYAITFPSHFWWLASFAILDFAAPMVFFLAGISAFCTSDKLKTPVWISASAVFSVLTLGFFHLRLGWKLFLEAAGPLLSVVFILGWSATMASKTAWIGTAIYALVQGEELILDLLRYWAFGDSVQYLLVTIAAPILVTVSLIVAICSHIRARKRITGDRLLL